MGVTLGFGSLLVTVSVNLNLKVNCLSFLIILEIVFQYFRSNITPNAFECYFILISFKFSLSPTQVKINQAWDFKLSFVNNFQLGDLRSQILSSGGSFGPIYVWQLLFSEKSQNC
jgi:hypothetical protein